jgi:hypothetical protein
VNFGSIKGGKAEKMEIRFFNFWASLLILQPEEESARGETF